MGSRAGMDPRRPPSWESRRPRPGHALAAHVHPVIVDRNRHSRQPSTPGNQLVVARTRIFECDAPNAMLSKRREDESQTLPKACDDDRVVGGGAARSDAPMVGGDDLPEVPRPGQVVITQLRGRKGLRRLRQRPDPVVQRHRAQIGDAVLEVDRARR